LRRSHIVLCSKVALLAVGVAIVICVALFSAPAQTGYEAENRVGDWILNVRVTPANITVNDNITIDATVEYTGPDNLEINTMPLVNQVCVTSTNGTDNWEFGTIMPGDVFRREIGPQFSESYQNVVGPNVNNPPYGYFLHRFALGMHWVEAFATVPNPDGSWVNLTVALPIEVKPGLNPITQTTTTTPLITTTTLGGTTTTPPSTTTTTTTPAYMTITTTTTTVWPTTTTSTATQTTGTIIISALYAAPNATVYQWVPVLVSVSGPENVSGMTTTWAPINPGGPIIPAGSAPTVPAGWNVLTFNLIPGEYTVSGTYEGIFTSENVIVSQGTVPAIIFLYFNG
jgi:hypothetical protein